MQGLLLSGRYRLGESIGRGGMGRVWRAHDEVLHRTVAVKELTAAQYAPDSDRRILLARTQTEARAAARVNHPAVVTIHDVLEHDDRPWIVMELVEGASLADAVKGSGPLDVKTAAHAGLWVLRALRAAHAAGVLHRDVKPGNVLLADDGRVLLTDFGIAQMEGDTTLTKTGEIVGSVDYLSPERVRGADPGPACDLWALGATLYTAVDGNSPFRRGTPLATMQAVVDDDPAPPEGAGVLGPVIMALLNKDPALRPTAEDAETMLVAAAEGRWPEAAQTTTVDRTQLYESLPSYGSPPGYEPPPPTYEPSAAYAPASQTQTSGIPGPPPPGGGHPTGSYGSSGPAGSAGSAGPAGSFGSSGSSGGPGPYGPYETYVPSGAVAGAQPPGFGRDQATAPGGAYPLPAGRGRRWWSVVAGVVAAALLAGGGTAVGLYYAQRHQGADTAGPSETSAHPPGPAPSSSDSSDPATEQPQERPGGLPEGWTQVHDPEGFSLAVPEGWKREIDDTGTQIDYTPDHGNHFIRISVDRAPDWASPLEHQQDLERQIDSLPDYSRVRLEPHVFRDQDGARWEFTWTAAQGDSVSGPRHAIEQTWVDHEGVEYAVYMSTPEADWPETRKQFDVVLRSWRS